MMPLVEVKGIKRYKDQTGKWYCYHRASGQRIYAEYGTGEFFAELKRAEEGWKAKEPLKGTFGALVDGYRESPEWKRLAPRTKADYEKVLRFLEGLRMMPTHRMDRAFVTSLRNKAYAKHKRRFANYVVQVMSRLCEVGIGLNLIRMNPAEKVDLVRKSTGERSLNRAWTLEERDAVLEAAPPHLAAPIALARYLGVRLGDMVAMKKDAYRDGRISFRTNKSNTAVSVPAPKPLKRALAALPEHRSDRLLVNSFNEPWTVHGFSSSFRKHVIKLRESGRVGEGLTFHGLRHSVATDLREAGYSNRQIADVLGQKTEAIVSVYSAEADMAKSNAKVLTEHYGADEDDGNG